jgi:hypothetical protein
LTPATNDRQAAGVKARLGPVPWSVLSRTATAAARGAPTSTQSPCAHRELFRQPAAHGEFMDRIFTPLVQIEAAN